MRTDYDLAMLVRIRASKTEASKEVLGLYESGRRMSDAVLDVIESMSAEATEQLRRWSENWESWHTWMKFAGRGWWITSELVDRVDGVERVIIARYPQVGWTATPIGPHDRPRPEDVAAGADIDTDHALHQIIDVAGQSIKYEVHAVEETST